MLPTAVLLLIAAMLVPVAAAMIVWHLREWQHWQQVGLDAVDLDYRRRQFQRRMQTSAMLGLLGLMMAVGQVLTGWLESPWFTICFWSATLLLVAWLILLALVDIWATRRHFGRLQRDIFLHRLALEAAQRRAKASASDASEPAE